MRPKIDKRHLREMESQVAANCKLWSGAIDPIRKPLVQFDPTKSGTMRSMYRMDDRAGGSDFWLSWPRDVDAIRGAVVDARQRLYYTGDHEPRITTYEMASAGTDTVVGANNYPAGYGDTGTNYPLAYYVLGVPNPVDAIAISVVGGVAADITRAYLYTYVTAWGEESGASPVLTKTGKPDGSWDITGMGTAPLNTGSISGAAHAGGYVTVTTTASHWLKAGHRIAIASVTGMTDLNASWTVYDVPTANTFRVALTTAQTYSAAGTWKREAPWNVTNMTKRIYRTLTGTADTVFQFVAEVAVATTTYNDTIADTALGPVFATEGFDTPDGTMTAIAAMPNGMTAGAAGNEVCFAEPYKPYAWPVQYRQPVNYPVVGLAVFGQTLGVITTGQSYRAQGTHPESVSMQISDTAFPCRAKRGIQSMAFAVVYPTDTGLAMLSPNGDQILTAQYFSRDEWESQAAGGRFEASMVYGGRYYAFWETDDGLDFALVVDPNEQTAFITQNTEHVNGAWTDPESGFAYIIDADGKVSRWDSDASRRQIYQWKSREFKLPAPLNFGAARVEADFTSTPEEAAAIVAENAARVLMNEALMATMPTGAFTNDPLNGSLGSAAFATLAFADTLLLPMLAENAQYVQFQILAASDDGTMTVRHSKTLETSQTFRLPGGYRSDQFEFNIVGNVRTRSVKVAETADGLRNA